MKIEARLISHFALAGIGSLGFAIFTPQSALAAPTITLKASFNGDNGRLPVNAGPGLVPAGNGIFYGTAQLGGAYDYGAIFEFNPSGAGSITHKASFDRANGYQPFAALVTSGNGLFYGTTIQGGAHERGSIFEFNPSGAGSITRKVSFDGANGQSPFTALTPIGNGLFYGTTLIGGANNLGTIFEFNPSGAGSITLKASFNGANGQGPRAELISAGNGLFYGTASSGGAYNKGSIFEFDPSGVGSITLKASFNGDNGERSFAALTPVGNGLFYGTANSGGAYDKGSIFEFDPSGAGSITLKASFNGDNGARPQSSLMPTGNGTFYGTTLLGGIYDKGTIFEFDPSGAGTITLKASFAGANGEAPTVLTSAGNGIFYGNTVIGGQGNNGTIFEFSDSAPTSGAPGPLPLLGATAAFGWSRKLRRRIQPVRPVFPIGR